MKAEILRSPNPRALGEFGWTSHGFALFPYLYFMPGCFTLASLEDGAFCIERCPRLRATMATVRNRPRVLGLLAFCRLSLSSALRLLMLWSEQTKETCILAWSKASSLP